MQHHRLAGADTSPITGWIQKIDRLMLYKLSVCVASDIHPIPLNNCKPNIVDRKDILCKHSKEVDLDLLEGCNVIYDDVDLRIPFIGTIIICDDFIQGLYVHMGFQDPYKYKKVMELSFENGMLTQSTDQSEQAQQQRINAVKEDNREFSSNYIDRAFNLDYKDKWID